MDSHTETTTAAWNDPHCPFAVEYSMRVMDDIRLAVVDAFFSLPRGGAEIGGVLLGTFAGGRLVIADYLPLDCEHAFGPGFVLSPRDFARLAELLASGDAHSGGLRPVGWYHSHTRTEIFLSEADLEIYNRYFPEPFAVALVLKPHTFQPAKGGFFFREPGGAVHSEAPYSEFLLEAMSVRPLPGRGSIHERPLVAPSEIPETRGRVVTLASQAALEPAASKPAPAPEPDPAPEPPPVPVPEPEPPAAVPMPRFLQPQPERSLRWIKALTAVAVGVTIGAIGYQTRDVWLPPILALWPGSLASTAAATLGLTADDENGQLQIRWDGESPLIRNGSKATLQILDAGSPPQTVWLDDAHLRSGSLTYVRHGDRADVTMTLDQPGGRKSVEATSVVGKPAGATPPQDPALVRERDDLARINTKLESDLRAEVAHRKLLEKAVADLRLLLRLEQQRRMGNQAR